MKISKCANNRIHWVDFYKTFSIFLIVLGHSVLNFEQLIQFLFLFHVPLFFFISGYLEKISTCDTKKYLTKTAYALIIPYFLWNILTIIFHFPITYKSIIGLCVGLSIWNGASWFLGVLFFMKLLALSMKNRTYIVTAVILLIFCILFFINKHMPYYINLTFMYVPFFLAGMYGKKWIDGLVSKFENKPILNFGIILVGGGILLLCFKYIGIPHTHAVVDFTNAFYLYWLTGFVGIIVMFFLCICFNKVHSKIIEVISTSTLFIMCSHYEIIHLTTKYITEHYNDIWSIIFVLIYFLIQCACIPFVLKYVPILAGRKK